MKTWYLLVLWCLSCALLTAQVLDQPVATMKLGKAVTVLSQKAFRERVKTLEARTNGASLDPGAKKALIEVMITEELIRMDMEAQKIRVTEDEVMAQFHQTNPGLSDAQIRDAAVSQSHLPWDELVSRLKDQLAKTKYFSQYPGFADLAKIQVSDEEILQAYQAHETEFLWPQTIRISHVFFDLTARSQKAETETQNQVEEILKKIRTGQLTFEEVVVSFSEDASSAGNQGDLGYFRRSKSNQRELALVETYGVRFFDALFALKKGEVSGILRSTKGFHLVRITEKWEKRFLGLDDPVAPGQATTVRQYLYQILGQERVANTQAHWIAKVGEDLRKKATITIFEQNQ